MCIRDRTTIAPYSLRGRPHPTVAVPRTWDELDPGLPNLELDQVIERLADIGDPLAVLLPEGAARTPTADRLSTYRSMRDAGRTPEPVPAAAPTPGAGNSFVIQEHHARRLHYDFRLEHDGVLVSWAIPKGPPTDPQKNHLAVQTEDHPLEYGSFEGEIPKGEYGGGTVTIWDAGTYELEKWRDGKEVIATLTGRPDGGLGGAPRKFALIHTKLGGDEKNWLIHLMNPEPPKRAAKPAPPRPKKTADPEPSPETAERPTQQVVVVGWSPSDTRPLASLLVAVNDGDGLRYAGKVGTGFTEQELTDARQVLDSIGCDEPQLAGVPKADAAGVQWVDPLLVGRVEYTEWTAAGRLRYPVWRGWCPECRAEDVVRADDPPTR